MSFVDEQLRAQQVNQTVSTVTAGLKQVAEMIEVSPEAAAVGLQALLLTLDTMPAGKEFHDEVKQTLEQLIEQAKQPKPDKPDLKMLKIEIEQQKVQMEGQKQQLEAQAKWRELDRKDAELQLKAGTEQFQLQLTEQLETFLAQLEAQRVQIEQFKAQMQARESEMEEIRLAREVDVAAYQAAVETAKEMPPEPVSAPPVVNVINVKGGEPSLPPITPLIGGL
jgi:hypothetical protein